MVLDDAVELLRPAIAETAGTWADFGAGSGTFTQALAVILDKGSTIYAIDRDAKAVRLLRAVPGIVAAQGDIENIDAITEIADVQLDGAIFANTLHFVSDAERVLTRATEHLKPGGRIVVIEYERDNASQWVPYPLPFARLRAIARNTGLAAPEIVATRPSTFRGTMYCAAAVRPS